MKTVGIVLLMVGGLYTFDAIVKSIAGTEENFAGLMFVALGVLFIIRANKEEEQKKQQVQ